MKTILFAIALMAALYGLHRLALWMEDKGWIYYRQKRASPNALGNAVLSVQQILQPDARHIVEAKQERTQEQHGGEPKTP